MSIFRIFLAIFGVIVILSTGYEIHSKRKKKSQRDIVRKTAEVPTEIGPDIKLQRISAISSQEVNSKAAPVGNGVYESQETNGSTNVLVQPNLQLSKGQEGTPGWNPFLSFLII